MAIDPRQILSGFLTLTMFAMLGRMIKRDHFDTVELKLPEVSNVQLNAVSEQSFVSLPNVFEKPWKEDFTKLKQCWTKPSSNVEHSNGFITFSLTNSPGYHVSQIANAVVVARYLGATLILPDIRGSNIEDTRNFGEIYDVEKFVKSLKGVVKVVKEYPAEISRKVTVIKVPNRVTKRYIKEDIEPVFRANHNLRLATYFPSVNMKKTNQKTDVDSIACLAMYEALDLQPEAREVVDLMINRLRTLSRKSKGQFVAVDLRIDILENKGCQGSTDGKKICYSPQDIGIFLRKIGFNMDTTIYLTQTIWHSSLDALKEMFPKTYTKHSIMPAEKKNKFLKPEGSAELQKALDFYICSESDVFVPAISGLFYGNVAGKRIAAGKTQILVPNELASPGPASNFISTYVTKKNHFAYSCFCEEDNGV